MIVIPHVAVTHISEKHMQLWKLVSLSLMSLWQLHNWLRWTNCTSEQKTICANIYLTFVIFISPPAKQQNLQNNVPEDSVYLRTEPPVYDQ